MILTEAILRIAKTLLGIYGVIAEEEKQVAQKNSTCYQIQQVKIGTEQHA